MCDLAGYKKAWDSISMDCYHSIRRFGAAGLSDGLWLGVYGVSLYFIKAPLSSRSVDSSNFKGMSS